MGNYIIKQAADVRTISTLSGDFALKCDDQTPMSMNAHAVLVSQFAKTGGFLDHLVSTCPMEQKSNNAPSVRDLIATVLFSMINGATRFRHVDRLLGDKATAKLLGAGRFMSCDSVRRNFASMLEEKALKWVWSENMHLLQDILSEDYTDFDLPAKDILRLYRERGDCENIFDEMKNQWGWNGLTAHSLGQTALFAGLAVIAANLWNIFTRLGEDGSHREAATSRPLLQSCIARLSRHARSGIVTIYTSPCEKAAPIYRAIVSVLSRIASASQLNVEQRRQLIIAWAFRQYGLVRRLFPPLLGDQQTLALA